MPRATTTRVKDPVQSSSSRTGQRRRVPYLPLAVGGALVLAALWAGSFTPTGRFGTAYLFVLLDFFVGVVALVALSLTVMAGLVSTDRILLRIGHRVLFQGVHRATSILAVVALGVHIAVKVLGAHAAIGDVLVPFYSRDRSLFIGFGTVAAYLMLLSFWAGMARTRFVGSMRPWIWRATHCTAYVCWLAALGHGLNAGRPAATWVTVSYLACVVGVALALLVRIYTRFGRYSPAAKTERTIGVTAQTAMQTAMMPRFADGAGATPAVTRSPVPAPRSPMDLELDLRPQVQSPAYAAVGAGYEAGPASYGPAAQYAGPQYHGVPQGSPVGPVGPVSPAVQDGGQADWADQYYPEQDYYQGEAYPSEAYPGEAYPADEYPADEYLAGGSPAGAGPEPPQHDYWAQGEQSRQVPLGRWVEQPERPRLRLVANNDVPADDDDAGAAGGGRPRARRTTAAEQRPTG
jgi:hypothetical protein